MGRLYSNADDWSFATYLFRRIVRIWPLWLVFTALSWPLWRATYEAMLLGPDLSQRSPITHVVPSLFFLGWINEISWTWTPPGGWSVQAEMAAYLIFPLVRCSLRRGLAVLLCLQVLDLLARQSFSTGSDLPLIRSLSAAWPRLSLASTFIYFMLGLAGSYLVSADSRPQLKIGRLGFALILISCCLAANIPYFAGSHLTILGVVTFMMLLAQAAGEAPLVAKFLARVGRISFFLYFIHFWLILGFQYLFAEIFSGVELGPNMTFFACVIFVLLTGIPLGSLSWKFVESPLLVFARKMERARH